MVVAIIYYYLHLLYSIIFYSSFVTDSNLSNGIIERTTIP